MSDIRDSQKNTDNKSEAFSDPDKIEFDNFFKNLKLSKQMNREFEEWLPEIAYAEKCDVVSILKSSDLDKIKNSAKLNGPQKLSKIREILYSRRYPELSKIKNEWIGLSKQINPDKDRVQFKSDPYFEKSEIELKITAGSSIQLKKILNSLLDVDDEKWDKIIDPFKGVQ